MMQQFDDSDERVGDDRPAETPVARSGEQPARPDDDASLPNPYQSPASVDTTGKNTANEDSAGKDSASVETAVPTAGAAWSGRIWRLSPAIDLLWTAVVIPAVSLLVFFLASIVMMVLAYAVVHGQIDRRIFSDPAAMRTVSESRIGLLLLVVAPQLALVAPALIAAKFSSVPFRSRLSLVRGHWPLWAWVAAAVTTPLIGWVSSIAVGTLMDESENLKVMSDIFRGHGQGGFLIPLAILIGATPALCEELLFRGFVQTRLRRRFGAVAGIFVSSALFAVFHMDWVHIVAVFPLGVYLGTITWRSGSLFPAMLAHFVNNSISVFAVVLAPEEQDQMPSLEMGVFLLIVLGTSLAGAIVTAVAFWRVPVPRRSFSPVAERVFP